MKKLLALILLIQIQFINSQKILKDYPLSNTIEETSGLEIIDNMLITHNDSGGEPVLYYLNKKGEIVETRKITGVKNNDWEDVTKDDEFIYVANMGNNFDTRKNLSIIKIPIKKSLNEKVELINFLYPEQKKFNTIYSKSQYDAEGIVSINDDLIIFTKNKLKKITEVYSLPKSFTCLAPRLEVIIITVFLKSTFLPKLSVKDPSSSTCKSMLKISGCAFSTSSSRITLYGFLRTFSVSCPPSSYPT
jgi:hypothetical protein